ncbi:serine hydrolase [Coleofasciculus sp. H7-2]|uniref:serine hydrolase n=1 Tax=Coleofasciculus sp. H7-2 TaxID=3351545 RepID=UPI0036707B1F
MTQQSETQSVVSAVSGGSTFKDNGQSPNNSSSPNQHNRSDIRERRRGQQKRQPASQNRREALKTTPLSVSREATATPRGKGQSSARTGFGLRNAPLKTEQKKSSPSLRTRKSSGASLSPRVQSNSAPNRSLRSTTPTRTPSQFGSDVNRGRQRIEAPLPQTSRRDRSRQGGSILNLSLGEAARPYPVPSQGNVRRFQKRPPSQPAGTHKGGGTSPQRRTRSPGRPVSPWLYGARLLILGVGIGAIAGTVLSAWDPATRQMAGAANKESVLLQQSAVGAIGKAPGQKSPAQSDTAMGTAAGTSVLTLNQEIPSLKAQVQALVTQNSKLNPGVFLVELDTGAYLDWSGNETFPAASTIKVPILVAFFQDVDAGKIRLDEPLTLEKNLIGSGSGDLQYKKLGTKYTALEVATKMIAISDNTATNMLIHRLGGVEALNQRFQSWGLTTTVIHNALPDLEGTNTTSPKELATVMAMVNQGNVVSVPSRDRILHIMQQTVTDSLLPRGLGKGASIAHKTGDIGSAIADVGLIDMPTGKRYIAAVMVQRPHNDGSASELIRQISRAAYQHFSQPATPPSSTVAPSGISSPIPKSVTAENPTTFAN